MTGRSHSATTSRRMWMLSASRRSRCVSRFTESAQRAEYAFRFVGTLEVRLELQCPLEGAACLRRIPRLGVGETEVELIERIVRRDFDTLLQRRHGERGEIALVVHPTKRVVCVR